MITACHYYMGIFMQCFPLSHSLFFLLCSLKEKVLPFKTISLQVSFGTDPWWSFRGQRPKKYLYFFKAIKQVTRAFKKL